MSSAKGFGAGYSVIFLFFFLLLFNEGYGSKLIIPILFLLIFLILFGGWIWILSHKVHILNLRYVPLLNIILFHTRINALCLNSVLPSEYFCCINNIYHFYHSINIKARLFF